MNSRWLPWCLCSVFIVLCVAHRGDARPNYKKAFDSLYVDSAKKSTTNCSMCHSEGSDDKKQRNHYGVALAKELGEKMVKNQEKIIAALKAIEDGECRSGKWKLRLDKGLAPCVCGRGNQEDNSYIARQLHRVELP